MPSPKTRRKPRNNSSPYAHPRTSSRLSSKKNKESNEMLHKYGFTLNQYQNYVKNKTNNYSKRRKKNRTYNIHHANQEMSGLLKRTMINRPRVYSPKNPFIVNKNTTLEDLMKMLEMK